MKCQECQNLWRAERAMAGVAPYFVVPFCGVKENQIVDPEVDRYCDLFEKGTPHAIDRAR